MSLVYGTFFFSPSWKKAVLFFLRVSFFAVEVTGSSHYYGQLELICGPKNSCPRCFGQYADSKRRRRYPFDAVSRFDDGFVRWRCWFLTCRHWRPSGMYMLNIGTAVRISAMRPGRPEYPQPTRTCHCPHTTRYSTKNEYQV